MFEAKLAELIKPELIKHWNRSAEKSEHKNANEMALSFASSSALRRQEIALQQREAVIEAERTRRITTSNTEKAVELDQEDGCGAGSMSWGGCFDVYVHCF